MDVVSNVYVQKSPVVAAVQFLGLAAIAAALVFDGWQHKRIADGPVVMGDLTADVHRLPPLPPDDELVYEVRGLTPLVSLGGQIIVPGFGAYMIGQTNEGGLTLVKFPKQQPAPAPPADGLRPPEPGDAPHVAVPLLRIGDEFAVRLPGDETERYRIDHGPGGVGFVCLDAPRADVEELFGEGL